MLVLIDRGWVWSFCWGSWSCLQYLFTCSSRLVFLCLSRIGRGWDRKILLDFMRSCYKQLHRFWQKQCLGWEGISLYWFARILGWTICSIRRRRSRSRRRWRGISLFFCRNCSSADYLPGRVGRVELTEELPHVVTFLLLTYKDLKRLIISNDSD